MNYQPSRPSRKVTATAPVADAATSADTMPKDLSDAVTRAEALLDKRRQAMETLSSYSVSIPALLKELTVAKPGPALDAVRVRRETAARDRQALIEQLRDEEPVLVSVRREIEEARQAYSATMIAVFQQKYAAAVATFQEILAEGAQLSACLRTTVDMPLPVAVAQPWQKSLDSRAPSERPPWWIPDGLDYDKPPIVTPVLGSATHPPDAGALRIGIVLDGLQSAIEFCTAIREWERRASDFAGRRYDQATTFDPAGIFTVAKPLTDALIGSQYAPGELVDSSLLPVGMLLRAFMTRSVRPFSASVSAPASIPASTPSGPPVSTLPFAAPEVAAVEV